MRIGITGHQVLSQEVSTYSAACLRNELSRYQDLVGVSSLAAGADQMFAHAVLALGGALDAVIPADDYELVFATSAERDQYRLLLSRAASVAILDFPHASEVAFLAAGEEVVRRSDMLVAVWDGQPSRGIGGTADVVRFARQLAIPTLVIWPHGASR